jgi:hypothetical protein
MGEGPVTDAAATQVWQLSASVVSSLTGSSWWKRWAALPACEPVSTTGGQALETENPRLLNEN